VSSHPNADAKSNSCRQKDAFISGADHKRAEDTRGPSYLGVILTKRAKLLPQTFRFLV